MSESAGNPSIASHDVAMRDYYAQRAREYESIYAKPERQSDLALLRRQLHGRYRHRRVLDVACGTGYWTACYAPNSAEVVGVDANREVLEVMDAKHIAHCRTTIGDCYALDPALGTFDGAFAGFWFSHVARRDRGRFFASLHARLAPGARVVLIDNLYVAGSSTPISETDESGDTWQERRLNDGSSHRVLKNFPTYDELRSATAPVTCASHWWTSNYFWWFEYELPRS